MGREPLAKWKVVTVPACISSGHLEAGLVGSREQEGGDGVCVRPLFLWASRASNARDGVVISQVGRSGNRASSSHFSADTTVRRSETGSGG
eukprot:9470730-Pyramimonas_sp.AAC.1